MNREVLVIDRTGARQKLRDLRHYKELFWFLIRRDILVSYKQTIFGLGWAFLRPLLQVLIFAFVFGRLAGIRSDGVPYVLFSYVGVMVWLYFSSALNEGSGSIVTNSALVTKIYFPRILLPLVPVVGQLLNLSICFVIAVVLLFCFGAAITPKIFLLPLMVALLVITVAGMNLGLSGLAVRYRDVKYGVGFLTNLLMYAAPVVWPLSYVEERYGHEGALVYCLYPVAAIIEGFRAVLLNTRPIPWDYLGTAFLVSSAVCIIGVGLFHRCERDFADVI